ncbi:MAG: helix-turn-helix domain-containing protein [Pleurocapsa minor HA4230-MV1]|jgi:probable addiction module antidote protein|nr:helix-turn-helix domain-containing protein [Pleurocapsa minor HA4230-MV1]
MPTKDYKTDLLERLSNSNYAAVYLKAALDETLLDGNTEAFLLALKNVVEAKGSTQAIANESKISRQHLYRILSGDGNPTLDTLTSILQAVGLTIDFKPVSVEE